MIEIRLNNQLLVFLIIIKSIWIITKKYMLKNNVS